jgi:hypothetical protein
MTAVKRFSLALSFTLFVFVLTVPAQTPSIEVSTDNDAAEFSAQGDTRKVHVEVYAPAGELVFETADADGQAIRWGMTNQKGARVADGVYLATITVVDSLGKKRKRIEQIAVSSERQQPAAAAASTVPSPDAPVTTTVNGTAGRLAKFTNASTIGNSVVAEGAGGKVGVNVSPTATLQVNGLQPAPLANTGAHAPVLLQTSGGKGGNTTASGKAAGAGASISLVAGNGGDAPSGSVPGKGGSITLQPGSGGAAVLREADASKPLGLNYMALLPVAVKAIQEQQEQIREQQRQIERLRAQVTQQQSQLLQQQAQLNQVRRTVRRKHAAQR